jgi:hypothetical protein
VYHEYNKKPITLTRTTVTTNQTDYLGGYYFPYYYELLGTPYYEILQDRGETITKEVTFAEGSNLDIWLKNL